MNMGWHRLIHHCTRENYSKRRGEEGSERERRRETLNHGEPRRSSRTVINSSLLFSNCPLYLWRRTRSRGVGWGRKRARGSPCLACTAALLLLLTSPHPVLHPSVRPRRGFISAPPRCDRCESQVIHTQSSPFWGKGWALLWKKMFRTQTPQFVAHLSVLKRDGEKWHIRTRSEESEVPTSFNLSRWHSAVWVAKIHFKN